MAPMTKENDVLTATPETNAAPPSAAGARPEDTSTGARPQPVALEVPVTVNGARTVDGSDKREPFSETTKTVLVFGTGAVIRLGSPVAPGQLLFLTNEKTKKEVVCQVVKSKNYKSVSGYVELEFTESVVGFWGMRFPSDRIAAAVPAPVAVAPAAPKIAPVTPIAVAPKPIVPAVPVVSAAPKIPDLKPVQVPAPPLSAEVKPLQQPPPVEVKAVAPATPKSPAPVAPTPAPASSLAASLASLLAAPEVPTATVNAKSPAPPASSESKQVPAPVATDSSTEDLKAQTARLQEQLSSMLFSADPTPKPVAQTPAPQALDTNAISNVAAKVFEVAKSEPPPIKLAPPAKTPAPVKSSIDTEEVKIPSWLEPLARNAAIPGVPQDHVERETPKAAAEISFAEEHSIEPLSAPTSEAPPESDLPMFGSLLPLDENISAKKSSSGSSGKGLLFVGVAAGVLLAAGAGWYFLRPSTTVPSTSVPVSQPANNQPNSAVPASALSQPASQSISQPAISAPQTVSNSNASPNSSAPASNTLSSKAPSTQQTASVTRDNTRGSAVAIPASETERISRPTAEPAAAPEPKKPVLGQVHLASPTLNRPSAKQDDSADAPTISGNGSDTNPANLSSGLAVGNGKQPSAPEAPLPVGGDVKTAKLISTVSPVYPALAKTQHVSGDVRVDALIDANGRVTTMNVISGPTLLHQAAKDALRQWKYQPATLDGKAVPMHLTVTLQFRLQ